MSDPIAKAREALREGVRSAFTKFRAEHADEKICTFALYNDHDGVALDASAQTEEALQRRLAEGGSDEATLRWCSPEWGYEGGFGLPDVYQMISAAGEDAEEDDDDGPREVDYDLLRGQVFAVMVLALADLDQEGLFGAGEERKSLAIFCTLSDSEDTGWLKRESAKRLNPPAVFKKIEYLIDEEELRNAREEFETYQVFLKVMKKHGVAKKPASSGAKPAAPLGAARHFEFSDGKSNKFWEISVAGAEVTVRFGRIGTQGQTQTKSFADSGQADKHAAKLIEEKVGKGYEETTK